MTALLLALLALPPSIAAAVPLEPVRVWSTAYSCDAESPMYPCNTTRWGNDPLSEGVACPVLWAHQKLYIASFGVQSCDDSGKWDFLTVDGYTRPHIDIRMGSHGDAVAWGIRDIVVYRVIVPRKGQERKGV